MDYIQKVVRTAPNIINIYIDLKKVKNRRLSLLVQSDEHLDSPKADRVMHRKHLQEAKDTNSLILKFGDTFDAMQGQGDGRATHKELHKKYLEGKPYLQAIVDDVRDELMDYRDNIIGMGIGNHEVSIIKHHGVDLIDMLIGQLNGHGANIHKLGYTGWIRFVFKVGAKTKTRTIYYTHGHGGGGLNLNRMNKEGLHMEGADFYLSGHNHVQACVTFMKQFLTVRGELDERRCRYMKLPTYKNAWGDGTDGWDVERGLMPRPLGGWWIDFDWSYNHACFEIETNVREAF